MQGKKILPCTGDTLESPDIALAATTESIQPAKREPQPVAGNQASRQAQDRMGHQSRGFLVTPVGRRPQLRRSCTGLTIETRACSPLRPSGSIIYRTGVCDQSVSGQDNEARGETRFHSLGLSSRRPLTTMYLGRRRVVRMWIVSFPFAAVGSVK